MRWRSLLSATVFCSLAELDKRREAILKSLEERGQLTEQLKDAILAAESMTVLEDIYLPYRPKRRTKATIAREKGLEPLAIRIFSQEDIDPAIEAAGFVDPEKGVASPEEALAGARDIIAEWVNEDQNARAKIRGFFFDKGRLQDKGNLPARKRKASNTGTIMTGKSLWQRRLHTGFWPCGAEKKRAF